MKFLSDKNYADKWLLITSGGVLVGGEMYWRVAFVYGTEGLTDEVASAGLQTPGAPAMAGKKQIGKRL